MPDANEKVLQLTEKELNRLVDERVAKLLGGGELGKLSEVGEFGPESVVYSTPSVLSLVRATAYAHC